MADPITLTPEELQAKIDEATAPLKAKADELLGEKKSEATKRRELEARLATVEQESKAHKAGITSQELERLRAEVRADLDKEYQPVKQTAEELRAENRRLKLDDEVKKQIAKSGARGDRVEELFRLTKDQYDLTDDGKPMLRERPGTTIEKFLGEELKSQYPEFYEGSGSSGGGAPKSAAGGAGVRVIPESAAWTKADIADVAAGKAVVK